MTNKYDIGDQVRIEVVFTDEDGAGADPSVIVCKYRRPNGNTTTLEYGDGEGVTRDSEGSYYVDVVTDMPGVWAYRWEGTGVLTAAAEGEFMVLRSAFQ